MNGTDIILCIILTLIIARGAYNGFLRSLIGPLCFFLGLIAGYCVFLATHHFPATLLTALFSPLLFTWMFNSLLFTLLGSLPTTITFPSRIAGATVSLIWNGSILALILISITILPFQDTRLDALRQNMRTSKICMLLETAILGEQKTKPSSPAKDCPTSTCDMSEAEIALLENDPDIQALLADARIQRIQEDKTLREAMKNRNIPALLSNPALTDLMKDPQFLGHALKSYLKIRTTIAQ